MVGSISRITLSDGSTRYRPRYRDPGGRQHERRFARKVDAQRWLDEATSALVTQTWTAPERGRITVADWADRWLSSQTGSSRAPSTGTGTCCGPTCCRRGVSTGSPTSPTPTSPCGWPVC